MAYTVEPIDLALFPDLNGPFPIWDPNRCPKVTLVLGSIRFSNRAVNSTLRCCWNQEIPGITVEFGSAFALERFPGWTREFI